MTHPEYLKYQALRRLNTTLAALWTVRNGGIAIRREIKSAIRQYRNANA